jgi:putative glutamine amidotransferase
MAMNRSKPLVLVPACNRRVGQHPFHIAGKKYIDAVRLAGCIPLVVPSAEPEDFDAMLDTADGLLLTGSPSNVHPSHFDEAVHDPSLPLDPARDAWTLPLIPKALERGLPFFAICRGAQETNVALGGSLHQAVHEVDGHLDHRDPDDEPLEVQYGPAHSADVLPGGVLARLLQRDRIQVNSLHGQAVKRRRRDRSVFQAGQSRLQPRRAMAPGVAGGEQSGLDGDAVRVRRGLRSLQRPTKQVTPWS